MVDFTNLESVMAAIDASIGTPLPADFYTSAINGLSNNLPANTTNLFGTGVTANNLIGSLLNDDSSLSAITSTDAGRFLNDPRTVAALQSSLQPGTGINFNGLTDVGEVLNGVNPNSLFGQVSLEYAKNVSGDVYAILPDGADPNRIFGQVELQALLTNTSVTSINGILTSDLRALGSLDSAFGALQNSYNSSISFLLGDAYMRGVLGGVDSLNGFFQEAGISTADNDFYRMATEQVEFANTKGLSFLNFAGSATILNGLEKAGYVGDAVGIAIVASQVIALNRAGRSDEAADLLESAAVSLAGGAVGGYGAGVIALAILAFVVPEPSSTVAGAVVLAAAIGGGFGGELLAQSIYEGLQARLAAGEQLTEQDFIDIVKTAEGNCFAAGTLIQLSDGSEKQIEDIEPGDRVQSYDPTGALVPGRVTRTFRNEVSHLLDVHGLKVTPGHVTFCGDGQFAGRHVPIIDILLSDGALVRENGELIRLAINKPVGSLEDQFVQVRYAASSENLHLGKFDTGRMRVGTLLFCRENKPISVLDCMKAQDLKFDPETGLVSPSEGNFEPLNWFGPLPRPEDFILRRSQETLDNIITGGEWEGAASELITKRLLQTVRTRVI